MAGKVRLSVACGDYEIFRPIVDGTVEADGLELVTLTRMESRERHWRMARNLEFDVAEFNVGAYFMARERDMPITAIPVFGHRRFRHGFAFVNAKAGINGPKDLIGKRVGGTNFQPAGSIWLRGILEEHYGVPHKEIIWVTERDEDVAFDPPPRLGNERIAPGRSLDTMLAEGELSAMINPDIPPSILRGDPRVKRLFAEPKREEQEYFKKTGIFPIMHVTAIKQNIVDRYPWIPGNLAKAFEAAKEVAYRRTANPRNVPLAWVRTAWEEERALLGPDPWAYGLTDANRKNLETILRYLHQQGLIRNVPKLEDFFTEVDLGGKKVDRGV